MWTSKSLKICRQKLLLIIKATIQLLITGLGFDVAPPEGGLVAPPTAPSVYDGTLPTDLVASWRRQDDEQINLGALIITNTILRFSIF